MVVRAAHTRPPASTTTLVASPCFPSRQGAQPLLAPAARRPGRPVFPSLCGQYTAVLAPHGSIYDRQRQGRAVERATRPTPPSSTAAPLVMPPKRNLRGFQATTGSRAVVPVHRSAQQSADR